MLGFISRFTRSKSGNLAVTAALVMPALLGSSALALDYFSMFNKRSALQQIVDSAALAAAQELKIAKSDQTYIHSIVEGYVYANLDAGETMGKTSGSEAKIHSEILEKPTGLKVEVEEHWTPFFAQFFSTNVTPIRVEAEVNVAGEGFICVVGLYNEKRMAAVHLDCAFRGIRHLIPTTSGT